MHTDTPINTKQNVRVGTAVPIYEFRNASGGERQGDPKRRGRPQKPSHQPSASKETATCRTPPLPAPQNKHLTFLPPPRNPTMAPTRQQTGSSIRGSIGGGIGGSMGRVRSKLHWKGSLWRVVWRVGCMVYILVRDCYCIAFEHWWSILHMSQTTSFQPTTFSTSQMFMQELAPLSLQFGGILDLNHPYIAQAIKASIFGIESIGSGSKPIIEKPIIKCNSAIFQIIAQFHHWTYAYNRKLCSIDTF